MPPVSLQINPRTAAWLGTHVKHGHMNSSSVLCSGEQGTMEGGCRAHGTCQGQAARLAEHRTLFDERAAVPQLLWRQNESMCVSSALPEE
jgi:hypothetical protein